MCIRDSGKATAHRRPFMAHCFSCGASTRTLEQLLAAIGRMDLMVLQTADIAAPLNLHLLEKDEAEEIDDELVPVELPDFYKRTFRHPYLQRRGFCFDDYEYFPVGITGRLNPRYADYVVFPVIDDCTVVGLSLIHISEPTRQEAISYAVFCLKNPPQVDSQSVSYTHLTLPTICSV